MGARIDQIRNEADKYLAAIESANIYSFWGPTCEHPSAEAIWTDLGVRKGLVVAGIEPGYISMALPGAGGAVGTASVVEAIEREALKPDNRKKLSASAKHERHLAVYVYTNTLPWVALAYFEPPAETAHLPPEITNIWAFTERHNEDDYVVWMASAVAPWQKLIVNLRP